MSDADVIVVLGRLAGSCQDACQDAAASPAELAKRYTALRAQAMELNDRQGWATADEFDVQFPTIDALVEIESLDRALGQASGPYGPVKRGAAALLREALLQLAGWTTGVRLAQETLREMDSS
jgi:hypothetical protein